MIGAAVGDAAITNDVGMDKVKHLPEPPTRPSLVRIRCSRDSACRCECVSVQAVGRRRLFWFDESSKSNLALVEPVYTLWLISCDAQQAAEMLARYPGDV